MVVGAAVASSRNNKKQAAPQQPAASPASTSDDSIEQLKQLAELKDQGILTQEEFDAKKKQILGL
jgi:predicted Zn-dependent peptidase